MAKYKVTQVNGETSNVGRQDTRRTVKVDEGRLDAARARMRADMRANPSHSSDWIKVEKA